MPKQSSLGSFIDQQNKLLDSNHSCLLDNNVKIIPGVHKVNLELPVILALKYGVSVISIKISNIEEDTVPTPICLAYKSLIISRV